MNYYERHIGDYLKDTAHLSLLEHGIYARLLDVYYTREGGIPDRDAARLIGARSKDEREALAAVLSEFFTLVEGVHVQDRCEREVARFQDKQRKAKASADARWAKTAEHSGGNADGMRTHSEGNADGLLGDSEGNAPRARPQSPDTRHQEKNNPSGSSPGATRTPSIPCPYQAVVDLYHERLPMLPRVRLMTGARQKAMRKTWGWVLSSTKSDGERRATNADEALAWLAEFFSRAAENDWLTGRSPRSGEHANWQCDIDFLLTERGMKHVIEKTREAA